MKREELTDLLERALWTAGQSAAAAWVVGAGWKAVAAAGIGAGLSVIKTAARARLAKRNDTSDN